MNQLIPEWNPSEAVILAWPDEQTDWAPWLSSVRETYVSLVKEVNKSGASVVLLCRPSSISAVTHTLPERSKVLLVPADYNDTWARDYAFLTCQSDKGPMPVEFVFNGWGQKFDASKDNLINKNVLSSLCKNTLLSKRLVAEGGALEIDDEGTLLSTSFCLLNPKRNGNTSLPEYEKAFQQSLGCKRLVVIDNGHLEGDDTDAHIDTLVRFTPSKGLVIQGCDNRPHDSHYSSLGKLVEECRHKFPEHTLHVLPLPDITNDDDERLPASYANYLICNESVLAPIYGQPEDELALGVLQQAYPEHKVVSIDCAPLINQFGSLHCITMQVPVGTLKSEIIAAIQKGVSVHAS